MNIQKLKQKLNQEKNKIGLVGSTVNIREYDNSDNDVSVHINPKGWNVEISVKKDFNPINDLMTSLYAKAKKIDDGLETLLTDVSMHEFAHWELPFGTEKGCPYDAYWQDKIMESVKNALPKDKQSQASYVANAFEDMIINPRCKEFKGDFSGQVLFWNNEGKRCKSKGQDSYTPFYEAFVKLNMHLFGDKYDKLLLKEHYSNSKKVDDAVKKCIQDLRLQENIQDTSTLFNKEDWIKMASIFAKNTADLLEQKPSERLSTFDSGNGNSGQEEKPGNGVEEKAGTGNGKEEISYGRYSGNEKQSSNLTSYEQLDSLYKKLARPLVVKAEAMTRENSLNISPLNFRQFDEERDDINRIKLSKLFITDKGLHFAYPNQKLTIHAKSKVQKRNFPDFKMIVLDNSGSMKLAPDNSENIGKTSFIPWGDNSKYHYALLGFYGIENFLQAQGIAQYIRHGLSLFSDTTRYKESDFTNIDSVRKIALSPEFKNTYLDAKVLLNALKGRESFVLSLSDGEIGNWDSEKGNFEELAKNNHFAHIQIGSQTRFTQDLESFGVPVFYVNSGQDLSKLMVDATKNTYKRLVQ